MSHDSTIRSRKADHIRINLEEDVHSGLTTGLEKYRFTHRALPEQDLGSVDLGQEIFRRRLATPLLISSMTGGTSQASRINQILAEAAQETKIAMGMGSQRAAIEHEELAATFQVRKYAPDILLLANLGAVQLNYGYGLEECKRAVEMIEADALVLHFNALQEAVQPEGDTHFAGLAEKISQVCQRLPVPVIAKEVGWGFSEADILVLIQAGIAAIDVAGAGGTSWSQVEMHRAQSESQKRLAAAFIDWGIPTSEAIINVKNIDPGLMVIASGGLRSGVDIAKCIALGANLGGMASPFLKAASHSIEETIQTILELQREIQVCAFMVGVSSLRDLQNIELLKKV